jgi:hypothetical protein
MRYALLLLVGCTEHIQLGGDDGIPGLAALEVSPPEETISFDRVSPPAQHVAFTATGSFEDGHTEDVTDRVQWSASTPYPGTIDNGDYTATGEAVGHVGIRATSGAIAGDAALSISMTATIVDDVFGLPVDPAVFDGANESVDPMRVPSVKYPQADTRFPQELAPILFQHARGMGNDTVRLRFTSDVLDLAVITASDRWSDDRAWKLIAGSHPNSTVTLVVDGAASMTPGMFYSSPPTALSFSAVFSTDAGVSRNSTSIIDVASDPHLAVSRSGRTLALAEGGKLSTFDLITLDRVLPPRDNMGYAALSPDGSRVLVADRGSLQLRDARTGDPIGPMVALGPMRKATHPDWSPDGTAIALAVSDMVDNTDVKHASIARLPVDGNGFGPLEILVTSTGDMDNNFSPRWGPNHELVYVHATSGSKDAKNAELRVLVDGSVIRLPLASAMDVETITPSWTTGSDGSSWLAVTSTRPYGVLRPMKGTPQVWIAGLDLARPDPSFAAFWLPSQAITATSNGPVWAPLPTDQQ